MLIVDGSNVMGARPDGWWRDRDGAVLRLAAQLQGLGEPLVLVLDGGPVVGLPEGRVGSVEVCYALRPGRDAADDRIVDLVTARPGTWQVVTSDRALQARAVAAGATVSGARTLLQRLTATPAPVPRQGA